MLLLKPPHGRYKLAGEIHRVKAKRHVGCQTTHNSCLDVGLDNLLKWPQEAQMEWLKLRPPVAVVQPLPGIGDMVWHVPHIRAIAEWAGVAVTVLTKPRSLADQLLVNEASVSDVMWIDINPIGRRGMHDGIGGFIRLIRMLRARRFASAVFLHHSETLAAAAWLAGIPDRRGYGWGRQRLFLNNGPYLPPDVLRHHQHTRATRYLQAAGIALSNDEPSLMLPPDVRATARDRVRLNGPFIAMGIGSSEPLRQWGAERYGLLSAALLDAGWPMIVLLGGLEDAGMAADVMKSLGARACQVHLVLGWELADVMGVLAEAEFYVGNNTGVMNIAAAVATPTYALFGTTMPFKHARKIVPIIAPDIGVHDGMKRVTLESVLQVITTNRGSLSPTADHSSGMLAADFFNRTSGSFN